VGVSWHEAQAYCIWLSEKSKREYRLPSEEEWERTARHTDGREWVWGDNWEDDMINSEEAQIGRTTAVGAFPRGAAECGAQDMTGNMWEWTLQQGVRGGSWLNLRDYARVAYCGRTFPGYSHNYIGFRLVSPVF
jgi:formylglycine-generating enzyme required for sulfatase activity